MTKQLMIDAEELANEVAWLNKMPTTEPVSAEGVRTAVGSSVVHVQVCGPATGVPLLLRTASKVPLPPVEMFPIAIGISFTTTV